MQVKSTLDEEIETWEDWSQLNLAINNNISKQDSVQSDSMS